MQSASKPISKYGIIKGVYHQEFKIELMGKCGLELGN